MDQGPRHNKIRMQVLVALWIGLSGLLHAQDTRVVTEPKVPRTCVSLAARLTADNGRLPEAAEQQPDTERIQEAIDHCVAGRAVELRGDGEHNAFLSGPLELKPSVTLLVADNTVLFGSRDPRAYDIQPGSCGLVNHDGSGCKPLISARRAPHSGIAGQGAIDGQGGERLLHQSKSWWDLAHEAKIEEARQNCPRLLVVDSSNDFTLYGVALRNSPNFHVMVRRTDGFTAWGVRIDAPANARNTDGIDPSSSTNVSIVHSYIRVGDDNVAIKAGSAGPASHITVAHNHFYSGHGMSIGSETNGGVSSVLVSDLTVDGADNGIRIKSDLSRGGLVHDVAYRDVCMRDIKYPITISPFYTQASGSLVPVYQGISLQNVHSVSPGKIEMLGVDSQHPLDVNLDGVTIPHLQPKDVRISHAHFSIGPGSVNFALLGDDVTIAKTGGTKGRQQGSSCDGAFTPFPTAATIQPVEKSMRDEEPAAFTPHAGVKQQVSVAADGSGDYKTLQEGIDALSENGGTVLIKPGTYREVVHIAKPHVRLKGLSEDPQQTVIVYDNSAYSSGGTFHSATAFVTGDDFYAENLTFQNDYSRNHKLQPQGSQAIALSVRGDRAVFRNVRFLGAQDTLFAASRSCAADAGPCVPARQYFYNCYIEGNIDFIFGDAEAVFDHCHIHVMAHPHAYVTAQSKRYPEQQSGYIFDHCKITADSQVGKVFLGRPWRAYSTVIFLNSELSDKVDPAGWAEWHAGETTRLETAFYAEYGSLGPGSNPLRREAHTHQLSRGEAGKYTVTNFLAGSDGWNPLDGETKTASPHP
ncbi:MAG TPA: pectinesterase family protein [Candidatus Angelobacter sp.]|nr:pectinesterase family protein [Candidatus Angelobacter sp.]